MEAKYRAVRLGPLTSDLASLFRSAIERGGVEFIVDCEEDPSDGPPIYLAYVLALSPRICTFLELSLIGFAAQN